MFQNAAMEEEKEKKRKMEEAGIGKGGGGGKNKDSQTNIYKMLWSLDTRLRHTEGMIPAYLIPEEDTSIVPSMIAGNKTYDDRMKKKTAHPDGPRRTSLAAALLNCIAHLDPKAFTEEQVKSVNFYDEAAKISKSPSMIEQKKLLEAVLASYTTAQKMETEISVCVFFLCKKAGADGKKRYLLSLQFSPMTPLRHCVEYVRICIEGTGAIPADGPPPTRTDYQRHPKTQNERMKKHGHA